MKRNENLQSAVATSLEQLEQRVLFAAADLDVAFGIGGKVITPFPGSRNDVPQAVATTSSGKIIVAGSSGTDATEQGKGLDIALARYNADGSIDTTFGVGGSEGNGLVLTDFGRSERATAVTVLSSGKILVAGTSFTWNINGDSGYDVILARYNADGTLDTTFGVGGADGNGKVTFNTGGDESAAAMKVQADGRILVTGTGNNDFLLARFNSNGTIDTTFHGGSGYITSDFLGFPDSATCLSVLSSGKILVGGVAGNYASTGTPTADDFGIVRYNANGTLDTSFGGGTGKVRTNFIIAPNEFGQGGLSDDLVSLIVRSDGKIIAVGVTHGESSPFQPYAAIALARYSSSGVLETSVQQQDVLDVLGADATNAVALSTGKILVAGDPGLIRFNSNLTLDKTYGGGDGISVRPQLATAITLLSGDKVVAVGESFFHTGGTSDLETWRCNADGSLDTSFSPGGTDGSGIVITDFFDTSGVSSFSAVNVLAVDGDGRIVAGGTSNQYGEAFARYNPDGSLDTGFGVGGITYNLGGSVRSMTLLGTGEILALQETADNAHAELIRLNANGTLDTNFGLGGIDGNGRARVPFLAMNGDMLVQADGKIVVAGQAGISGSKFAIARFNADGSLDTTFGSGAGQVTTSFGGIANAAAGGIALAAGGKYVVAGDVDGKLGIARYNSNGTLDSGFSAGGAEGSGRAVLDVGSFINGIRDLVIQPGGQIDVIPSLYTFGIALVQLDGFGAFDTTFGGGDGIIPPEFAPFAAGSDNSFNQVLTLSSGQFLLAGTAGSNGNDFALARLNANGSYDPTFGTGGKVSTDFGAGSWDRGWAVAKTADGRIIVGGMSDRRFALAAYRGVAPGNILRIDGTTGNDSISVSQSGTALTIKVNGVTRTASTTGLSKVFIYGLDGDDTITVAKSVTVDAVLAGGRGQDRLHSGSGRDQLFGGDGTDAADYADIIVANYVSLDDVANDGPAKNQNVHSDVEVVLGGSGADTLVGSNNYNVLVGNGGNDTLTGNGGRDVLIGGTGKDTLNGGADDDLLIGSRTTFDGDLPKLRTLSIEWREPTRSYADRINRLKGGVLGAQIAASTVPNDMIADTLTGGSGMDWFVKHSGDSVIDAATGETVTVL